MPVDTREPHLVVSDSMGFRVEWGGTEQNFTDEEVLKKLEHMRDALRIIGIFADVTLHITAPVPMTIEQRAMVVCELWYECEGAPTAEQWNLVLEDMWQASCYAAQQRGEPVPTKPDFPPIPTYVKGVVSHLRPVDDDDPKGGYICSRGDKPTLSKLQGESPSPPAYKELEDELFDPEHVAGWGGPKPVPDEEGEE